MAKSKPKQLLNKKFTLNDHPDMEECVQDGWVVVKKQKVTILIPPLSVTEQRMTPKPGGTLLQPIVATEEVDHITAPEPDPPVTTQKTLPLPTANPVTIGNTTPLAATKPVTIENTMPLATAKAVTIEKTMPLAATKPIAIEKTMPLAATKPIKTFSNPPESNHRAKPGNPDSCAPNRRKTVGFCSARKARKHCGNLVNGHMLVNPKMRALNLERKLQRAGGLNSWLVSLGLGQFVKLFRCKHIGKVQLANLTMKKLKDLGADAVGPRRKLMHALDCLW